jgi:hypothetical protein
MSEAVVPQNLRHRGCAISGQQGFSRRRQAQPAVMADRGAPQEITKVRLERSFGHPAVAGEICEDERMTDSRAHEVDCLLHVAGRGPG